MHELAEQGQVIIVGRAGQVVLCDHPGALHVRIFAPIERRAERVAARLNISLASAQAQVEASDLYRRRYLQRFYHVRWDNPDLYDVIINTERVSVQSAAQVICRAAAGEQAAHPVEDLD
jgi:cytidylate kinase